jgi:hypothetical protein
MGTLNSMLCRAETWRNRVVILESAITYVYALNALICTILLKLEWKLRTKNERYNVCEISVAENALGTYNVTNTFPNWGYKTAQEKLLMAVLPASAQCLHRLYNESNARVNAPSLIALSSPVTVSWIDETASNLVPFIAVLNLGNNKFSQLQIREVGDGMTY